MGNNLEYLGYSYPMTLAITEALKVNPSPNPRVGAVLTDKHGQIKAVSNHREKGKNHAEINIFEQTTPSETDILYITLEPCFHSDTSPSCSLEILNQGIKNIVIGDIDCDQRTNGKSIDMLKQNKISVKIEPNANDLINPYYKTMHNNKSEINYILKLGMSSNNYITNDSSDSKYITNDISLNISHYLRAAADCILIGKNTLLNDKPRLNVRLDDITNQLISPSPVVLWGDSKSLLSESMEQFPNFTFLSNSPSKNNNVFCETSSLEKVEEYFLQQNYRNIFLEGGKSVITSYLDDSKIETIYEFKSSDHIQTGISVGSRYLNDVTNNFSVRNKHQLLDNLLTIYTKN